MFDPRELLDPISTSAVPGFWGTVDWLTVRDFFPPGCFFDGVRAMISSISVRTEGQRTFGAQALMLRSGLTLHPLEEEVQAVILAQRRVQVLHVGCHHRRVSSHDLRNLLQEMFGDVPGVVSVTCSSPPTVAPPPCAQALFRTHGRVERQIYSLNHGREPQSCRGHSLLGNVATSLCPGLDNA